MCNDIQRALESIQSQVARLGKTFDCIKPGLERFERNLKPTEEKLIQSGWTINESMMPNHFNEIGELIETDKIDDYFYELLINTRRNINQRLIKPYEESIFAYENKKYIICINTLVPILEGTIANLLSYDGHRMISICKKQLEKCPEDKMPLNRMEWNVNIGFINKLYCPAPFQELEPDSLNRNWLLHGRSFYDIKEIDCLRILNAIGTFCNM